jgi:hypothetical protein
MRHCLNGAALTFRAGLIGGGLILRRGGQIGARPAQEPLPMPLRHRLTLALPLALLMAAAVARAELGADTEASVLFTPAFGAGVAVAMVLACCRGARLGARRSMAGWLRAAVWPRWCWLRRG